MARILVVEDHELLRTAMLEMAQSNHYQAIGVADIETAKQKLRQSEFDLVITDFEIGDTTGVDLAEWMQENGIAKPVILHTMKEEWQVRDRRQQYDALRSDGVIVDYVNKNDPASLLWSAVEAVLGQQVGVNQPAGALR